MGSHARIRVVVVDDREMFAQGLQAILARLLPRLRHNPRGLGTDLTPREVEVLSLLSEGVSNQQMAEKLVLSMHTVRNHVQNVITKLGAHSKLEAVATAVREGILRK